MDNAVACENKGHFLVDSWVAANQVRLIVDYKVFWSQRKRNSPSQICDTLNQESAEARSFQKHRNHTEKNEDQLEKVCINRISLPHL